MFPVILYLTSTHILHRCYAYVFVSWVDSEFLMGRIMQSHSIPGRRWGAQHRVGRQQSFLTWLPNSFFAICQKYREKHYIGLASGRSHSRRSMYLVNPIFAQYDMRCTWDVETANSAWGRRTERRIRQCSLNGVKLRLFSSLTLFCTFTPSIKETQLLQNLTGEA